MGFDFWLSFLIGIPAVIKDAEHLGLWWRFGFVLSFFFPHSSTISQFQSMTVNTSFTKFLLSTMTKLGFLVFFFSIHATSPEEN